MRKYKSIILRILLYSTLITSFFLFQQVSESEIELIRSDVGRDFAVYISDEEIAKVADSNKAFAFDMYHKLRENEGNVIFSPFSLSSALAMIWADTDGKTYQEMKDVLHFTEPEETVHKAFNMIDLIMSNHSMMRINRVNSIWAQQRNDWREDFIDNLRIHYDAGIYNVDFINNAESARKEMNRWAESQTKGEFSELISSDQTGRNTKMVLTSMMNFFGQWTVRFWDQMTKEAPFTMLNGSEIMIPMMEATGTFEYVFGEDYSAIQLKYGRDQAIVVKANMTVIIPEEGKFEKVESKLSENFIEQIKSEFKSNVITLNFPRISFKQKYDVSDALKELGMPSAFKGSNFLRRPGKYNTVISNVIVNGFMSFEEEGTYAQDEGVIMRGMNRWFPPKEGELLVNRPFIFIIEELDTGSILFMGRVLDPS